MRVLILTDGSFANRERAMLSRLEVGLADEGVRVIHALPRSVAPDAAETPQGELFVQKIVYEDRGPSILRRLRDRRLADAIERLRDPQDERPVDIIHVFGEAAWATGADLAARFQAALALEIWSAASIQKAGDLRAPAAPDRLPLVFFAPDRPTEHALRQLLDDSVPVRLSPWGVHTPATAHPLLAEERAPSAMIAGSGVDRAGYTAALEGLAAPGPQSSLMIFADADAVERAGGWSTVNRLGLSERFTLTPWVEGRRDLTLGCDLLIVPEALGEHRSIVLDAMAAGSVVIAAADPGVGWLIEGTTGRLVDRPHVDRWAGVVSSVLSNPDAARHLAATARDHVRQHQRASTHVASVVDAYEWLTAGETLPFGHAPP